MYLYFKNDGTLTTQITHGQIPRQGSNLNIYALVSTDFFMENGDASVGDWIASIEIINKNGQSLLTTSSNVLPSMTFDGLVTFQKSNNSEVTYDLVDDEDYYGYSFTVLNEDYPSVTAQPGDILVGITFVNLNDQSKNVVCGESTIYIEPVLNEIYLKPVITPDQYNELKALIQVLQGYLNNVVTVTTDQTITGNKTFTQNVNVDGTQYGKVGIVIDGKTIYFPIPNSDDAFVLLNELNEKVATLGFSKVTVNNAPDSTNMLSSITIDGIGYKIAGGRKQIFNNNNVRDYEHKEDDLWLSEED